jgi:hypothetical protein
MFHNGAKDGVKLKNYDVKHNKIIFKKRTESNNIYINLWLFKQLCTRWDCIMESMW